MNVFVLLYYSKIYITPFTSCKAMLCTVFYFEVDKADLLLHFYNHYRKLSQFSSALPTGHRIIKLLSINIKVAFNKLIAAFHKTLTNSF